MAAILAGINTLTEAREYLRAGLSLIPIRRDGTKAPALKSWERYQTELPLADEVEDWFDRPNPPGIGVIGGAVSCGLECIDFDRDAETIFPEWCELVEAERPGLVGKLSVARTPKPGFHVRYRCTEIAIPGNMKLATDPEAPGNERTLIETRGEGGYAVAPGSPAECHSTGRLYSHHSGPVLSAVETISGAEREFLIRCARSFDRTPQAEQTTERGTATDLLPGQDFNLRGPSWEEILEPHGWCIVRKRGQARYWRRPGKDDPGWSATTGVCRSKAANELLAVFSSNASPFDGPTNGKSCSCYNKFSAFALLNHNGDFSAAAKALAGQGYGTKQNYSNGKLPGTNGTPTIEVVGLITTCLASIRPEPIRWLVPNYFPLGKLVLIAGDGGHGKSTLTLDATACLTTGRPCFGMDYRPAGPEEVLLVCCEDDFGDTVVPRLLAAGADLNRVWKVDGVRTKDGKPAPFSLDHFDQMQEELKARPNVRLVIIDPAGAYIGRTGVDDHKDSELRALLQPLADVAARQRVTIVLVKHLVKGVTIKAVHKVSGSAGYVNAVRAAFLVAPDPQDDDRKLFLPLKFNLGPKPSGLAYKLQSLDPIAQDAVIAPYVTGLEPEDRDRLARQLFGVYWLGNVSIDADQALADAGRRERPTAKDVDRATEWLGNFLAERPAASNCCVDDGNNALDMKRGLKWWRDSVLKDRLRGKPRKTGFGDGQRWWFTLPVHPWPFPGLEESEEGEESNDGSQTAAGDSSGAKIEEGKF